VSANADGANAIIPTTKVKTTKSEPISFDFMDPSIYTSDKNVFVFPSFSLFISENMMNLSD